MYYFVASSVPLVHVDLLFGFEINNEIWLKAQKLTETIHLFICDSVCTLAGECRSAEE
jgi:hypothetical protein